VVVSLAGVTKWLGVWRASLSGWEFVFELWGRSFQGFLRSGLVCGLWGFGAFRAGGSVISGFRLALVGITASTLV
jgi:hypothetical protein